MAPKQIKSNYRITVGIDPSQLKQYTSQIQEELNRYKPKATVLLDTETLRSQVDRAHKLLGELETHHIKVDFSTDALKDIDSFSKEVTRKFTMHTASKIEKAWKQSMRGINISVDELKKNSLELKNTIKEVYTSIEGLRKLFDGNGTDYNPKIVNQVGALEKNVRNLGNAFGLFDSTSDGFNTLKTNIESFANVIKPLAETLAQNPIEYKFDLPEIGKLKEDIFAKYQEFRAAIYNDDSFALRLKAIPTIAVSKNGEGTPTTFIDADVSKSSLKKSIATSINELNNSKEYPKVRLDIDRDYFAKQFTRAFDLKLSITNFEDTENKIKELRTAMEELRSNSKLSTDISGVIPSGKIQISDVTLENTDRILSGISEKIGRIIEHIGALSTYSDSYIPAVNNQIEGINLSSRRENILLQEKIKLVKQYEKAYLNAYSRYLESGSAGDKFTMQSSIEGINLALGDTVEEQAIKDIIINRIYSRQEELDAALAVKNAAIATAEEEKRVSAVEKQVVEANKQKIKLAKEYKQASIDAYDSFYSGNGGDDMFQRAEEMRTAMENELISAGVSDAYINAENDFVALKQKELELAKQQNDAARLAKEEADQLKAIEKEITEENKQKVKLAQEYGKAAIKASKAYYDSDRTDEAAYRRYRDMQVAMEKQLVSAGVSADSIKIEKELLAIKQEEIILEYKRKKAIAGSAAEASASATQEQQNYKDAKDLLTQIYELKNKLLGLDDDKEKYKAIDNEIAKLESRYEELLTGINSLSNESIDELVSISNKKQEKLDTNANIKYAESIDRIKDNAINTGTELTKLLTIQRNVNQYMSNLGKDYNNSGFDKYLQNIKELASLYKEIESISNGDGDIDRLPELDKRANILKNSIKEYEAALREANSSLGAQDKNFDKLTNTASELSRYMNEYGTRIKRTTDLYDKFVELQKDVFGRKIGNNEAQRRLNDLTMQARAAGVEVESLWTKLQKTFAGRFRALVAGQGLFLVQSAVRQIYQNVLELDTAMTELKKVTDETADSYVRFLDNAESRAKRLGATLVDVVKATSDFARLGYSIEQSSNLADAALTYLRVGDDVENIDDATSSLISTMRGFNIEAENAMEIINKFNQVSNTMPVSAGNIGEGLLRSASALAEANNSLDESIGLFTAGFSVVQNAESVGNMLKTTSMRIRNATADLEEAGLETEGMAESTAKLREQVMALTGGFDILTESGKEFKSTYDILKGVSEVWKDMNDVSQASLLELLAGKRNGNALAAIINNFQLAEDAVKQAQNSQNSATRELDVYLKSIQGRIDKLTASWQSLSNNLLDSDLVKNAISSATTLLDIVNTLVDKLGLIPGILAAGATAWAKSNNIGKECALLRQAA